MRTFGKRLLKFIIILCIIALVSIGVFFYFYNMMTKTSYSKYDTVFSETVNSINKTNSSISFSENITSIDDNLKAQIETARDSLVNERNALKKENPPSKYNDLYSNILAGLEYNIKIYKEVLQLSNLNDDNALQESLENLNHYANNCIKHYSFTDNSSFNVIFPEETHNMVKFAQKYILDKRALNDKLLLENSAKEKYIFELESVYSRFISIFQNRNKLQSLENARSENAYEDLLTKLDNELKTLNDLLFDAKPIIAPVNIDDLTDELHELIYNYIIYVQYFKHAVSFEMNSGMIDDTVESQLNQLYDLANSELTKCEAKCKSFENKFQPLKKLLD
ncbi:hypothetical protein [Oceanirhabdus sp. W0125-5]|uniref:hypothetical protein n=1 Tax=Oceanirhabdus sp. W0125-5 TaxID=2999116 RepID=UPI0022F2E3C2|nr:hypothetical protein [Oceanirhabdus sp. W0125-5]WBW98051.1 hypothetical protein OW730_04615 [Oceanirhabdus sp. W0125-5]